jgi:hypothetical protein
VTYDLLPSLPGKALSRDMAAEYKINEDMNERILKRIKETKN